MLALVLGGSPRIDLDVPEPVRGAGEALVRVRTVGVCDTDLQLARGYMGFTGVPGHEVVGDVIESDDPAWVGKRVVADINAGCGVCQDCVLRDGHHCAGRTVLGILGRSGALAERFAIPNRCLVPVPDGVSDDVAVFAEPLAAALHVLDEAEVGAARRAIVLGDGKLGQLVARALRSAKLETAMIGRHEAKLELARAAGVDAWLESEIPGSLRGADLVIEATGSASGLERALDLVRPRGAVVLKTTVATPLTLDFAPVVIHEIRVVGSRCGDMKRAIALLASGSVDPTPLVEARYPLARADEALAHAGQRGALKVLVETLIRARDKMCQCDARSSSPP